MAGAIHQQGGTQNAASGTTLGFAQASNPTVGNFLYVVVGSGNDTSATVADTLGHTFTARGNVSEAGLLDRATHFTAPITATGANTVTATYGVSDDNRVIRIFEISGVSAADAFGIVTETGSNPTDNVSATNTAQPAFAIAVSVMYQDGVPTVGTGYTDGGTFTGGTGTSTHRSEYKAVTTVALQTANFGNASVSRNSTTFVIFTDGAASGALLRHLNHLEG